MAPFILEMIGGKNLKIMVWFLAVYLDENF
jgi:hypothetical protein